MAPRKPAVPSSRSHLTLILTSQRRKLLDEICAEYPGRDPADSIFRALELARHSAAMAPFRRAVQRYLRSCEEYVDTLSPGVREFLEEVTIGNLPFIAFGFFGDVPETLAGRELTPRERAAQERHNAGLKTRRLSDREDRANGDEHHDRKARFSPAERAEVDAALREFMTFAMRVLRESSPTGDGP